MKRLFLGIPVPDAHIDAIERFTEIYKNDQHLADAKWTTRENFHITVFFLGDVVDAHIPEMKSILKGVCARMSPFELYCERIEFFAHKMPKMIWARLQRSLAFLEINQEAKKFMKPYLDMTLEEEMNEPIPHVTVARLRKPVDPKGFSFKPFSLPPLQVTELCLYESTLSPTGPEYTILDRYPFSL
ncbi:MAG: RNA 2',3'-cyclic phosphodiesterase [Patescibacteria group bacterium]